MDADEISLPEKCETLMINVIETRKHHGKKCMEYQQKSAQIRYAMLKLQLKSIESIQPAKKKYKIPDVQYDDMIKEMDEFKMEVLAEERRRQDLYRKIEHTQKIVTHILRDRINKVAKEPITTQALMAAARSKDA